MGISNEKRGVKRVILHNEGNYEKIGQKTSTLSVV